MFGPKLTEPPLPPVYQLYRLRFLAVSRWLLRCSFARAVLADETSDSVEDLLKVDPQRPEPSGSRAFKAEVWYSNHPSFWDPLVLGLALQRLKPNQAWVAPIDECAYRSRPYFRGLGLFPIEVRSARGLTRFLETCGAALKMEHGSVVVVTPEGRFSSLHARPLRLMRGLSRLLVSAPKETVVRAVALSYEPTAGPRFAARVRVGAPLPWSEVPPENLHSFLTIALTDVLDRALADRATDLDSRGAGAALKAAPTAEGEDYDVGS